MKKVIGLAFLMILSVAATHASSARASTGDDARASSASVTDDGENAGTPEATCPTICQVTAPKCCPGETCVRMSMAYGMCR